MVIQLDGFKYWLTKVIRFPLIRDLSDSKCLKHAPISIGIPLLALAPRLFLPERHERGRRFLHDIAPVDRYVSLPVRTLMCVPERRRTAWKWNQYSHNKHALRTPYWPLENFKSSPEAECVSCLVSYDIFLCTLRANNDVLKAAVPPSTHEV